MLKKYRLLLAFWRGGLIGGALGLEAAFAGLLILSETISTALYGM